MKTVKLTQNIDHAGLVEGDVINVDELSALGMIDRGLAEEYDPAEDAVEAAPPVKYGGQESRTIDDIRDPEAARMTGVQATTIVAGADPGPQQPAEQVVGESVTDDAEGDAAVVEIDGQQSSELPSPYTAPRSKKSSTSRVASGAQPAGGDADAGGDTAS